MNQVREIRKIAIQNVDQRNLQAVGSFIFDRQQVLGKGSFSVVYKGWDRQLKFNVAVK